MVTGKMYKHTRNRDVALIPLSIARDNKGSLSVRCIWFNVVNKSAIFPLSADTICISPKDLRRWEEVNYGPRLY